MAQAQKMQQYCELKVGNFTLHQVVILPFDTSPSHHPLKKEKKKNSICLEFCRLNVGDKPYSNTLESHLTKKPANMVLILVTTV